MNLEEFLEEYNCLTDLNENVKRNNIKNYGLENEVKGLIKGLHRVKKNNVLILGKAGIGKTALVEKLAEKINKGEVPKHLKNKTILELSLGGAVAGTRYRGEFEEKITEILNFLKDRDDIILFIDEIHNLLNAGGAEGAIAAGDIFKPFMARNKVKIIGATTKEEYKMTIKTNDAMDRRFSKLNMREPSVTETIKILRDSKSQFEKFYDIKLMDIEITNVVLQSKLKKGNFPDKAFDLLEDYCYEKSGKYE